MENTHFGGFSAGLRRSNQLAAVGGILVFGGLAAIFASLEFAGLLNRQRLAAKRPGYASLDTFYYLFPVGQAFYEGDSIVQTIKATF
jgi:hypothetical protein